MSLHYYSAYSTESSLFTSIYSVFYTSVPIVIWQSYSPTQNSVTTMGLSGFIISFERAISKTAVLNTAWQSHNELLNP